MPGWPAYWGLRCAAETFEASSGESRRPVIDETPSRSGCKGPRSWAAARPSAGRATTGRHLRGRASSRRGCSRKNPLDLPPELRTAHAGDNVLLDVRDDAPPRVTKWKRSLLDLSTRNRLLNLRPSAQVLDLHVPAGALPLLDDLVHAGKTLRLRPQDDLSDIHVLQGACRA